MRVLNQITFEAKDDAEALKLASERLGKDAVILSTRVVRVGGFMGFFQSSVLQVTAGILQDNKPEKTKEKEKEKDDAAAKERLVAFQKLLEFKKVTEARPAAENFQEPAPPQFMAPNGVPAGAAKVIYSPAGVAGKTSREFDSVHISQAGMASTEGTARSSSPDESRTDVSKLREDIDILSKQLESILQRLETPGQAVPEPKAANININSAYANPADTIAADARGANAGGGKFEPGLSGITPPIPAQSKDMNDVYQRLLSSEVEPHYAQRLVQEYDDYKGREPFVKWLESKINCAADTGADVLGGKKIMLFGPTGAGKTTTIAKLAAIQALWQHKNVLLLTSDTYRIAAVDQLRTYAKILGVPIEVIFEVENFDQILAEHQDAELILLDTAGRGQKDRKNLEAFETLHNVFKPDAVHLVLAANMKHRDMMDVVERMSNVPVSHVIFTKLDETVSYGPIFNILNSLDRPVSYFTTGQNVPNDIEVASKARLAGLLMGEEIRSAAP